MEKLNYTRFEISSVATIFLSQPTLQTVVPFSIALLIISKKSTKKINLTHMNSDSLSSPINDNQVFLVLLISQIKQSKQPSFLLYCSNEGITHLVGQEEELDNRVEV